MKFDEPDSTSTLRYNDTAVVLTANRSIAPRLQQQEVQHKKKKKKARFFEQFRKCILILVLFFFNFFIKLIINIIFTLR